MSRLNSILHGATRLWCNVHRTQFVKATQSIEATQLVILKSILKQTHDAPAHVQYDLKPNTNWKTFAKNVPITDYKHWQPWIQHDAATLSNNLSQSPVERHQPTSGSTSAIKWIPYSRQFLAEVNNALMPWIGDLYQAHPGIRQGYHYWSVSWVPTSLRGDVDENVNDDLKVLPWWKRWIAAQYMAVPDSVAQSDSSEDTIFATLAWLITRRDLSFLSVWSPTFALSLIEQLVAHKDELIQVLKSGHWLERSGSLSSTPCPRCPESASLLSAMNNAINAAELEQLWPHLALISCWDTASSNVWANKLQDKFPNARLQGKGLWATEGAVTIPFAGKYPLTVNSHYYEFLDVNSNIVVPSWLLEKGMEVSPILTTGTGFLRYKLNDKLLVSDFFNQSPCFEFKGRMDGTDLAGEKISCDMAQSIIDTFREKYRVNPVSLLAIPGSTETNPNNKGQYIRRFLRFSGHLDLTI
jgi:hypothetical protein